MGLPRLIPAGTDPGNSKNTRTYKILQGRPIAALPRIPARNGGALLHSFHKVSIAVGAGGRRRCTSHDRAEIFEELIHAPALERRQ